MPMYTWLAVMLVNRPSSTVASSSAGLTLAAVLQAFASWKAEGGTLGRRGVVAWGCAQVLLWAAAEALDDFVSCPACMSGL